MERKLVAILATDVVAYSRLMAENEADTFDRLRAHRKELFEPEIAKHHGRIFKLMGDGLLAEFGSVVDAVECAAVLQVEMARRNDGLPDTRRIDVRIGVHVGDVIIEGEDRHGDAVNVAARLEQLAEPGGICVSQQVVDHVKQKVALGFELRGEEHLKNIAEPMRVFRVSLDGVGEAQRPLLPLPDKPSIAVLAFENLSGEPDQQYFSDGITEDIITELARFRELLVIARNSSFAFRGKAIDMREVGRVLGASYLVEGSVRRAGNRLRITAQLIDAATGTHLWAERYDRPLEDVFAVQYEIARGIVAAVAVRVLEAGEAVARRRPPRDLRAYDFFLQARQLSDNFTPGAQERARELFERARELDPTFARAYTGLAFNSLNRAHERGIGVPHDKDPDRVEALRLAEHALTLDPNDAWVHHMLGYVCLTWREFDRARRHLDLSLAMNPNDANIRMGWAWATACMGEPERALPAAELAMRLNPSHPRIYDHFLSRVLFLARRLAEARAVLERITLEAPLRQPRDIGWRASACGHLGRMEEAQQCAASFLEAVRRLWRGDAAAGPAEYVSWLVEVSYLRRPEDVAYLREGLRLAGLPA